MKLPLQVTVRGFAQSGALETSIREKAEKLELFYPHIMSCRVVVEVAGKHKQKGQEFVVHIDLTVPGREIVIDRDHHSDVYVALRDAFDFARRQLEDYARRQRGEVKTHAAEGMLREAALLSEEEY